MAKARYVVQCDRHGTLGINAHGGRYLLVNRRVANLDCMMGALSAKQKPRRSKLLSMDRIPTGEEILKQWLCGTTCHRSYVHRNILCENSAHLVLHHRSHAEYCGSSIGTTTCESYAKLYAKSNFNLNDRCDRVTLYGDGSMKTWTGRISLKRIIGECQQIGIVFDKHGVQNG